MMHTHYQRGFICCAVGAITWGLNGAVSQFLFMHYPVDPAWLSAIRMICAGFLLLFLILPKKHRKIGCMLRDPTSLKKTDPYDRFRSHSLSIFLLVLY